MADVNIGLVTQQHCCALHVTTLQTQTLLSEYTELGVKARLNAWR